MVLGETRGRKLKVKTVALATVLKLKMVSFLFEDPRFSSYWRSDQYKSSTTICKWKRWTTLVPKSMMLSSKCEVAKAVTSTGIHILLEAFLFSTNVYTPRCFFEFVTIEQKKNGGGTCLMPRFQLCGKGSGGLSELKAVLAPDKVWSDRLGHKPLTYQWYKSI